MHRGIKTIEYFYPIFWVALVYSGVILAILLWAWFKDRYYAALDWLEIWSDNCTYKLLDIALGKHETYRRRERRATNKRVR